RPRQPALPGLPWRREIRKPISASALSPDRRGFGPQTRAENGHWKNRGSSRSTMGQKGRSVRRGGLCWSWPGETPEKSAGGRATSFQLQSIRQCWLFPKKLDVGTADVIGVDLGGVLRQAGGESIRGDAGDNARERARRCDDWKRHTAGEFETVGDDFQI